VTSAVEDGRPARGRTRRLGGLAAGLLVVAFLAATVIGGWDRVESYDWQLDAPFLVLAVVAVAASLALNALGYTLMLERIVGRRLPRGRMLVIWSTSMLARYVPGNVLMVTGRVVLGREAGAAGRATLAASVYEHAFLIGMSAIASVGLLLYVGDLGGGPWQWAIVAVPLGLVLLHPRIFGPLSTAVLRRFGKEPLEAFLSLRQVIAFACLYALTSALLATGVWATVRALTGATAGGPLLVGAGFLFSFVVSMLAFVFPSGLGVREGVLALVLARNLPGGVAIAAAAATRLVLTLVEIAFAGVVVAIERRRSRQPRSRT
jgi:uncharacterized membrane protein YbhN (UPF0104 family)